MKAVDMEKHMEKHKIHEGAKQKIKFIDEQEMILEDDAQYRCYCDAMFLKQIDMKNHVAAVHDGKKLEFVPTEVSDPSRKVEALKYRCHCLASYQTKAHMKRHIMYFHQG